MKIRLSRSLRLALMASYAVAAPFVTTTTSLAIAAGTVSLIFAPQSQAEDDATSLGNVMFVGDSITHGTDSSSYRWALHKILADNGIGYNAVGAWEGCKSTDYNTTSYGGVSYDNEHSANYGARVYDMAGSSSAAGTTGTSYKSTTVSSVLSSTSETIDNFFLLAGTNDFLSDGTAGDAGFSNNMDYAYEVVCNTQDGVETIINAMLTDSPDANVTLLYIPAFTDEYPSINDDESYQAVALYNHLMSSWLEDIQATDSSWANVSYVNTNTGLSDVTRAYEATYTTSDGEVITYTVDTMMHDDFTYESGDAVHLSDQASLIVASNLAKAMGYAGRTAGQSRLGAESFAVNVTSAVSNDTLTSAGFAPSGVTNTDTGVSLTNGSSISYAWSSDATLLNGYTLDLSFDLGNGATDGWDTDSMLSISLSGAGVQGTLVISEGYIMWEGNTVDNAGNVIQSNDDYSVLYSYDMSTLSDLGNLRIAYVAADAANNLAGGYYVWIDDMLIGEALSTSDITMDDLGVEITYNGDGSVNIGSIAVDGNAAYAPTTDGITTDDGYVADYSVNLSGPGTIASEDWAAGVSQTVSGNQQTNLRGLSTATSGDVSITVDGGTMSSVVYANQGAYTGDVWADITAGSISNTNWYAGHNSGTLTGDVYLKFTDMAAGTGGTVFGGVIGTIDGDVYLEFSSTNASFGTWSPNSGTGDASVVGSYQTNITGDVTMVFNAGTFNNRIMGGVINGNQTIGGSTNLYVNGGTFAKDIIAGGLVGTISGNTNLNISGTANIAGNIYGGGTGGTIAGNTNVTIDGTGNSLVLSGSIISAGGTAGTIGGNTNLTLKNIATGDTLGNYTGTLDGGTVSDGNTRTLNFDNVVVSSLAASITNFDVMNVSNGSSLGMTLTADKTLSLQSLNLTGGSTLGLNVSAGTSSIYGITTDSTSSLGTLVTTGNLTLGAAAGSTVKISSLNVSTGSITFDGGAFSVAAVTDVNQSTTNTINVSNGASVAVTDSSDWYIQNTNFAFTADSEGNAATMSYAGRMCLMSDSASISGEGVVSVKSFLLAGSSSGNAAVFNVSDGATLEVTTTLDMADTNKSAAIDGTLNIMGANLILGSTITSSGGTGQINVSGATLEDGSSVAGTALLKQGFTASLNGGSLSFNANDGAVVQVYSQTENDADITVSFNDGSTLMVAAGQGAVTMAQAINYGATSESGETATITFAAGANDSLSLSSAVSAAVDGVKLNANITGAGTVNLTGGGSLSSLSVADGATVGIGSNLSVENGVTLNGGTLNSTNGVLALALHLTSDSAISSGTNALALQSSISLDAGTSLDFANAGSVSIDTGFGLDLSAWTFSAAAEYDVFTNISSDLSTLIASYVSGLTNTDYNYSWTYEGGNLVLNVTEQNGGSSDSGWVEEDTKYEISTDSTSDSDLVINTDQASSESTPTIDTGSSELGSTTTGKLTISGDKDVAITGDNSLDSSTITVGNDITVTVSTDVSASDGLSVAEGSTVKVDENGSIKDTSITLGADATLDAGVITVTGQDATVDGTVKKDALHNVDISGASIVVGGASAVPAGSSALTLGLGIRGDNTTSYSQNASMDGGSLKNATNVAINNSAQLTMTNVVIGADTTFNIESGSSLNLADGNVLYASASSNLSITPNDGTSINTYTITTFSNLTAGTNVTIDGSLALVLSLDQAAFDAIANYWAGGDLFEIVLDGVDESSNVTESDITVYIKNTDGDGSYVLSAADGGGISYDSTTGKLVVTIPEPSTATLSILALAGLLARRRRRNA